MLRVRETFEIQSLDDASSRCFVTTDGVFNQLETEKEVRFSNGEAIQHIDVIRQYLRSHYGSPQSWNEYTDRKKFSDTENAEFEKLFHENYQPKYVSLVKALEDIEFYGVTYVPLHRIRPMQEFEESLLQARDTILKDTPHPDTLDSFRRSEKFARSMHKNLYVLSHGHAVDGIIVWKEDIPAIESSVVIVDDGANFHRGVLPNSQDVQHGDRAYLEPNDADSYKATVLDSLAPLRKSHIEPLYFREMPDHVVLNDCNWWNQLVSNARRLLVNLLNRTPYYVKDSEKQMLPLRK